jgi:hypothetical protein
MPSLNEVLQAADENIALYGNTVQLIFDPSGEEPPFAFTVGNCLKGFPELVMFGLPPNVLATFLMQASHMMREGELVIEDRGVTDDLAEGYKTGIRRAIPETAYENTRLLREYCEAKKLDYPEVFQLVIPDTQNRFPWEAGCEQRIRNAQRAWYALDN